MQIKELGARLKSIREAQDLSITDISDATKIQKHYIAAIEEGDLDRLPKGPYVRSFIRLYCDHISAQDIWKSYDTLTKKQKAVSPVVPAEETAKYIESPKVFRPRSFLWLYLLIAISLGAAGWITWQYRGDITGAATNPIDGGTTGAVREPDPEPALQSAPTDAPVQPVSADSAGTSGDQQVDLSWMDGKQPQPAGAAAAVAGNAAQVQAAPQPQAERPRSVKVTAEKAYVWTKISQGNKVLYEGTLKPGEFREFETGKDQPIRVRIGKPGSASVEWDGKKIFPVAPGEKPATKFFWPDGRITDNN